MFSSKESFVFSESKRRRRKEKKMDRTEGWSKREIDISERRRKRGEGIGLGERIKNCSSLRTWKNRWSRGKKREGGIRRRFNRTGLGRDCAVPGVEGNGSRPLGLRYIPSYFLRSHRWRPVMDVENSITRDLWLPTVGYIYCRSISFWPPQFPSPPHHGERSISNIGCEYAFGSSFCLYSSNSSKKKKEKKNTLFVSFDPFRYKKKTERRMLRKGRGEGAHVWELSVLQTVQVLTGGQTGVL